MHLMRRSPATGAAGAVVAWALVMAGCALGGGDSTTIPTDGSSPTTTATTPAGGSTSTTAPLGDRYEYGGEVVIGELDEPISLNPFVAGFGGSAERIGQALWVGVADVDGFSLELVPDVVVELPSVGNGGLVVNADGTESVEFVIDPLAVWADGTPISGEDFRFTYEVVMDPLVVGVDRSGYEDIVPGSVVVGEKSFRFVLSRPSLVVESLFSVLLPAHVVAGTDLMADWNDRMWVSGGPFQFEQWSRGEFLTLTRNPAYWKVDGDTGQQLPFLDRVVFRFVGDVDTLVAEFEARRLDVITPGADAVILDRLAGLEGVVVDVVGNGQWEHLSFQFGEGRLVRNPGSYNSHLEFRRAVAHAVDRDRVAAELFGSWGVGMDSYVEAFTPGWSQAAWAQYDYDPDTARTALTELCAKPYIDCTTNPPTVVFTTSEQRVALAAVLEPMFTEVGIAFRAELEPRVVFLGETIEYGTFDLAEWSWAGRPGLESLVCLHRVWDPDQVPPLGSNHYRFGSPAYQGEPLTYQQGPSSLINESSARMSELATLLGVDQGCHPSTVDRSELLTLVAEAEQILANELVFIPLYQNPEAGVVWADEVAGYKPNPTGGGDTWNIASWHRIDG